MNEKKNLTRPIKRLVKLGLRSRLFLFFERTRMQITLPGKILNWRNLEFCKSQETNVIFNEQTMIFVYPQNKEYIRWNAINQFSSPLSSWPRRPPILTPGVATPSIQNIADSTHGSWFNLKILMKIYCNLHIQNV